MRPRCEPGGREEGDYDSICNDTVLRPVNDGFLIAVLTAVARANDRKDYRGKHSADRQISRDRHVADQNTVQHRCNDGRSSCLLCDLVR